MDQIINIQNCRFMCVTIGFCKFSGNVAHANTLLGDSVEVAQLAGLPRSPRHVAAPSFSICAFDIFEQLSAMTVCDLAINSCNTAVPMVLVPPRMNTHIFFPTALYLYTLQPLPKLRSRVISRKPTLAANPQGPPCRQ